VGGLKKAEERSGNKLPIHTLNPDLFGDGESRENFPNLARTIVARELRQ
jgi:hypothetical protein